MTKILNKNVLEGNWEQLKGNIQKQWGKLTHDDLDIIEGNRKKLSGMIQERYGLAQEEAEKQVSEWSAKLKDAFNDAA